MDVSRSNDTMMMGQSGAQGMDEEHALRKVHYICGSCGKDNAFDGEQCVKCHSCGHRIFYKKRDRKLLQYEAR